MTTTGHMCLECGAALGSLEVHFDDSQFTYCDDCCPVCAAEDEADDDA